MDTDRLNYLNIALMVASAMAAFVWPFEVFLLAYVVLGPLHYLTEISWLHDRRYFLASARAGLPLVLLCVVLMVASLASVSPEHKSQLTMFVNYAAFAGAAILLAVASGGRRTIALAIVAVSFIVVDQSPLCRMFFGVLLPTIVHVLIFTGAFVLLGALRTRSRSALVSLIVMVLCAMNFFVFVPAASHAPSRWVTEAYAPFEFLNVALIRLFNLTPITSRDALYQTGIGVAVMRLIAFAYLYHYLNWFSKTSIIKWNAMPKRRAFAIVAMWMASVALYASGSRIGMTIVISLSFLHGMLELPLDHRTFLSIGCEVLGLADGTLQSTSTVLTESL
jgi:hypothetical protein